MPVEIITGSKVPAHGHSCLNCPVSRLLQYTLHGAPLEDHPEASIGPECNDAGSNGHFLYLCSISSSQTPLALNRLLDAIQGTRYHLCSMYGIGPVFFCGIIFSQRYLTSRQDRLWVPSLKECHLMRPRRHAFLVADSDL